MRIALEDLRLDHLTVLHPGTSAYTVADRVTAVPMGALAAGDPKAVMPPLRSSPATRRPRGGTRRG